MLDIIIFRFLYITLAAAVLTGASYKMFQILQLSSYRIRGVWSWFKTTKFDYLVRYFALSFLSFVGMAVYLACFSVFWWAYYLGVVIFLGFSILFIVISTKSNQKTPLKLTARIWRLTAVALVLYALTMLSLLILGTAIPVLDYALSAAAAFFIPLVAALAHFILLPIEKLIQCFYKKKTIKLLLAQPELIKIGITGSFGKTTAKNILAKMLSKKYKVLSTPASYNTPMGICKSVNGALTPDIEVFIAEMGARNLGDIAELCSLVNPSIGIITGVGNQHLETFGSKENIWSGKYELIESLEKNDGSAFLCGDNAAAVKMFEHCSGQKTLTGVKGQPGASIVYSKAESGRDGTKLVLEANGESVLVSTVLLGKHIAGLITLCASVALSLGVGLSDIAAAVADIKPVKHRLELIDRGDTVIIDDAYNSNFDGAKNALEILSGFSGVRIVVTPGLVELGTEEEQANSDLGKEIARCADYAVLDSSRGVWIKKGCLSGGMAEDKIILTADLNEAMEKIADISGKQKVILFENDLPDNLK